VTPQGLLVAHWCFDNTHMQDHYREKCRFHFLPPHCGHHLNPIEGFWRVMKDTIGAGRCCADLHLFYQRTHQVLMAHHERPISTFRWSCIPLQTSRDLLIVTRRVSFQSQTAGSDRLCS
jgi:hypothetical protein